MAIYLSLGLRKERTSYRRSFQPSKENTQHFNTWNFFIFFFFLFVIFALLNPDPDQATQINADSDLKPWSLDMAESFVDTSTATLFFNSSGTSQILFEKKHSMPTHYFCLILS